MVLASPGSMEFRILGPFEAIRTGERLSWVGRSSVPCSMWHVPPSRSEAVRATVSGVPPFAGRLHARRPAGRAAVSWRQAAVSPPGRRTMEFGILGPLEVRDGGGLVPVRGARQRALLTILVLHANEVVASGRLVDL